MEDKNSIFELMKEYRIKVSGMDEQVKARIWRIITEGFEDVYTYEFSHYFLTGAEAREYWDEIVPRNDFKQAEILTLQYLERFTVEFGEAKKNIFFK